MTYIDEDVDRVWAAMLESPAPPLPTAEDTLRHARTSRRRRAAWAVGGSGLASALVVAAVAAGAALFGPQAAGGPAERDPAVAVPVAPGEVPLAPPPAAPTWERAHDHGDEIGAILVAAVPSGYTGLLQRLSTNGPAATFQVEHGPRYSSSVYVIVTNGRADGLIRSSIYGGEDPLGDDICSPAATAYLRHMYSEAYPSTCETVTINGVQIRLSSTHDAEHGDINRATRLLDGGILTVEAEQGLPVHRVDDGLPPDVLTRPGTDGEHTILGGWPALPAVPLTTAELAAIVANPGLLP
jgi:hypothetical protein